MVAFALHLNIYWMGKASLFRFPFGSLMRWLGGIAVHREHSSNLMTATMRRGRWPNRDVGITDERQGVPNAASGILIELLNSNLN